jgi:hypothetical protein
MKTFDLPDTASNRVTHYLFRYPAKFHPPVAKALVERLTAPGDTILDPFSGSGTLLVEAILAGRSVIGIDIDPVAVAVASAKTRRIGPAALKDSADIVINRISPYERTRAEYITRMHSDLSEQEFNNDRHILKSYIPEIPNIEHWFRRYVIIDLGVIWREISLASIPPLHKEFLSVVFASIIRNASNADPVPVSGLEVTAHMRRRDEQGRLVNPFDLFNKAVRKGITGAANFFRESDGSVSAKVFQGDARYLSDSLAVPAVNAVITSPPYHGAVDYYRRHKLEMFWLQQTSSQRERLELLRKYIGRTNIAKSDPLLFEAVSERPLVTHWERRIREVSEGRGNAFLHYMISMTRVFSGLATLLAPEAPAVFIVGHNSWNGTEIPTSKLFQEISADFFSLHDVCQYPVKNRYMSYKRHNGADIRTEYVLVLKRNRNPSFALKYDESDMRAV